MFNDVEDIERSWRSLKVEMNSYCNILHAMMTKVCVTVCAKCLIFFTPPNMIGDDWSAAQGTQKVTLPSVWTATLSGALGLIAPLEQDEMQSNDSHWVWCLGLILESGFDTCFEQDEAQSNADLPVIRSSSHGVRQHLLRQVQFSWSGANPWLLIPGQWYPAAFTNHFIKKIGAIECITKSVFSIKCKTKVLYEMTPFYPWNDPLFHYIVYVEPLFSNHSSSIFESSMNLEARH